MRASLCCEEKSNTSYNILRHIYSLYCTVAWVSPAAVGESRASLSLTNRLTLRKPYIETDTDTSHYIIQTSETAGATDSDFSRSWKLGVFARSPLRTSNRWMNWLILLSSHNQSLGASRLNRNSVIWKVRVDLMDGLLMKLLYYTVYLLLHQCYHRAKDKTLIAKSALGSWTSIQWEERPFDEWNKWIFSSLGISNRVLNARASMSVGYSS